MKPVNQEQLIEESRPPAEPVAQTEEEDTTDDSQGNGSPGREGKRRRDVELKGAGPGAFVQGGINSLNAPVIRFISANNSSSSSSFS